MNNFDDLRSKLEAPEDKDINMAFARAMRLLIWASGRMIEHDEMCHPEVHIHKYWKVLAAGHLYDTNENYLELLNSVYDFGLFSAGL